MSPVETFYEEFRRSIAQVITALSGNQWSAELSQPSGEPCEVYAAFRITGSVTGEFALAFSLDHASSIAAMLLGTPAPERSDSHLTCDETEAIAEAARQFVGSAMDGIRENARDLKADYVAEQIEWAPARSTTISLTSADRELRLSLLIGSELADALSSVTWNGGAESASAPVAPACSPAPLPHDSIDLHANLPLLMDVELEVALRFGRRELLLKDVLELRSGSVLELDREVNEPVDLLLDGRVIARGEVVIVDGNYGLRVTEVAAPNVRAQSVA